MRRVDSLEKTVILGGIGGRRRRGGQRMRWLDGITDLMDMSWVNSRSWWWTGRPGVVQFMGSQRIRHDWVTELNWPEWSEGDFWVCQWTVKTCTWAGPFGHVRFLLPWFPLAGSSYWTNCPFPCLYLYLNMSRVIEIIKIIFKLFSVITLFIGPCALFVRWFIFTVVFFMSSIITDKCYMFFKNLLSWWTHRNKEQS